MKSQDLKKSNLPDFPGVYFFKKGKSILYIGKATSLRDRTKSYFSRDLIATRGPLLVDMVVQADKVEYTQTDSVLEAIILEAELIKKHQPKYNTKEKDNKSFNYVCITRDSLPQVLVIRGRKLVKENYQKVFGPFPNGTQLREAMRIIRRIFPYFDNQSSKKQNTKFYEQLGLVPELTLPLNQNSPRFTPKGPYSMKNFNQEASLKILQNNQYKNNIKNLILFFQGKKKQIIVSLKKEMMLCAKRKEFELAGEIKKKIFALEHINDVALIKDDYIASEISREGKNSPRFTSKGPYAMKNFHPLTSFRIEAYDIAHMGGKNMVGVMTVVVDGEVEKGEYKKFIIRTQTDANDTGALEEVLSRRLRHTEWGLPDLIVMDGSTAQVNVAKQVTNRYQFPIPIVGVVKDDRHKAKAIIGDEIIIKKYKKDILLVNSESHRFAIAFHKDKRNKNFLK